MTSVTATMMRKNATPAAVGLPRLVFIGHPSLVELILEALDLRIVGLVGPEHVDEREDEGHDDHSDSQRDTEGGVGAYLGVHDALGVGDEKDIAVVGDEQDDAQHD